MIWSYLNHSHPLARISLGDAQLWEKERHRGKWALSKFDPKTGSGRLTDTSSGPWSWQGPSILRLLICSQFGAIPKSD